MGVTSLTTEEYTEFSHTEFEESSSDLSVGISQERRYQRLEWFLPFQSD